MSSQEKLSRILADATTAGQNVYVYTTPEILDFTNPDTKAELTIHAQGANSVTVSLTTDDLPTILSILKISIFAKGMKVIAWNWKSLASFAKHKTNTEYSPEAVIIDLKVVESFAGTRLKPPGSLPEALNRIKALVTGGTWKTQQRAYQGVYSPLVIEVVPTMETAGLINVETRKVVYACYEICGQANGRLNSGLDFRDGYHPHSLGVDIKKKLKPRGLDELFMYFDFRHMEVSVLQWLSKDEQLGEALKEKDVYLEIYRLVVGRGAEEKEDRIKAKKFFLPVIYGQSAQALGHRLKLAPQTAESIVSRIHELFPKAISYTRQAHEQAKSCGFVQDMFGKRRQFPKGEEYDALNFSIQAPASTICLEKLVKLHFALKGVTNIAYSVHDGYCVFANKNNWKKVFAVGYKTLTDATDLCPGLRLRVSCCAGRNLDSLKTISKTVESE